MSSFHNQPPPCNRASDSQPDNGNVVLVFALSFVSDLKVSTHNVRTERPCHSQSVFQNSPKTGQQGWYSQQPVATRSSTHVYILYVLVSPSPAGTVSCSVVQHHTESTTTVPDRMRTEPGNICGCLHMRSRGSESSMRAGGGRVEDLVLEYPEGPSTQYLRTLVPKTIPLIVFGTRVLNIGYLDPLG